MFSELELLKQQVIELEAENAKLKQVIKEEAENVEFNEVAKLRHDIEIKIKPKPLLSCNPVCSPLPCQQLSNPPIKDHSNQKNSNDYRQTVMQMISPKTCEFVGSEYKKKNQG